MHPASVQTSQNSSGTVCLSLTVGCELQRFEWCELLLLGADRSAGGSAQAAANAEARCQREEAVAMAMQADETLSMMRVWQDNLLCNSSRTSTTTPKETELVQILRLFSCDPVVT